MQKTDVLIIGAGAAGLMAARTLARAGKKVAVLEARDRIGGRIHTITDTQGKPMELGAEFIHGYLPTTLVLINKANIPYYNGSGEMWNYRDGSFTKDGEVIEHWDELVEELENLQHDQSINSFLKNHYAGDKYKELRAGVRKYVAGYDTADPDKVSSFALRDEWKNEQEGANLKVEGGYSRLIDLLADECKEEGNEIYLDTVVKEIHWHKNRVKAVTGSGLSFEAERLVIALPLGVLQAEKEEKGAVTFTPQIIGYSDALDSLGFGAIIKILLEFDEPFWESEETEKLTGVDLKNMSFILSNEEIPTWWTQVPERSSVLTGWLGGGGAMQKKGKTDDEICEQGLNSLANIFKIDYEVLKAKLMKCHIINWTNDPFTLGSYAYDTLAASESRKLLGKAIDNTIYFAGEYMYEGPAMGTVEAALTSGYEAAKKILS